MASQRSRSLLWLRTTIAALVAVAAALLGLLSPTQNELHPPVTSSELFPSELLSKSPLDDRILSSDGQYAFGRWKQPVSNVTLHSDRDDGMLARLRAAVRTKMWHYSSFNTPRFFVGMAIVNVS